MTRQIPYNQKQVDRLKHIEEIFEGTKGWTRQLMFLYEERKQLRINVSRMKKDEKQNG